MNRTCRDDRASLGARICAQNFSERVSNDVARGLEQKLPDHHSRVEVELAMAMVLGQHFSIKQKIAALGDVVVECYRIVIDFRRLPIDTICVLFRSRFINRLDQCSADPATAPLGTDE